MNIFILDYNPEINAQYHCDKHVTKMILEYAQILCTTVNLTTDHITPYRSTHINHPCTKWARQSFENFDCLYSLFTALNSEFKYRYSNNNHLSFNRLKAVNIHKLGRYTEYPTKGLTDFALAMPDDCKTTDAVTSYRNYYYNYKQHLFSWTKRNKPTWIDDYVRK